MIDVMPTPRFADLEITSRCNARCTYCYFRNNQGVVYQDAPTERWLQFMDEMGRAKALRVSLAGGEPLLREDIFEIIAAIVRNHMRFELLTNGWPVTHEIARRIKETGRCSSIQVSLDGSRPETHEAMRGVGSFEPALQAIKILREAGLPLTVRVTVHGKNIEDLPATAHLLLDEIGLSSIGTNSVSSLGTHTKYADGAFLTPAQRLRAMHVLAELDAKYPGRISAAAGPLADWKMFHAMRAAAQNGKPIPGRGYLVGCGCIMSRIAVRADGAYVPCVMLPQMVLGYIGHDPLEEVWRNSPAFNALRERASIALTSFEECQGCAYLQSCTGNCAGTALSIVGEANRPSPEVCLLKFEKDLEAEGLSLWQP